MSSPTPHRSGPGQGTVDLAVEAKRSDRSLGDLFSEMTAELSTLFRNEVELAKVEKPRRAEARRQGRRDVRRGCAGRLDGAFCSRHWRWRGFSTRSSILPFRSPSWPRSGASPWRFWSSWGAITHASWKDSRSPGRR